MTPPTSEPTATRRTRRSVAGTVTIALAVLFGAASLTSCSSDAPTATPASEVPGETLPPFDDAALADAGGEPATGGCGDATGASPMPAGGVLATPGARQMPGPGVTVTSVPQVATSIVMQTPGNPDEASPARSPEGVGTPTPPYVIATTDDASPSEATTTTTAAPAGGGAGDDAAAPSGGCGGAGL